MENKFKKGDWVRCIDDGCTGRVKRGQTYKVRDAKGIYVYVDDNPRSGMAERRFEPWQPKVGERVRYSDDMVTGVGVVESVDGRHCEGLTIGVYVEEKDLDLAYYGAIENVRLFEVKNIEPVTDTLPVAAEAQPASQDAPAPLTIQAGKFYKTRDGRKVGPMEKWDNDSWSTVDEGRLWSDDGSRYFESDRGGPSDLIAEWHEPTNVAATVDAINDEYGPVVAVADVPVAKPKFKVGDRVKVIKLGSEKGGSSHWAKIGDEFVLHKMNPDKIFWYTIAGPDFYPHEITLVEPTPTTAIVALIEDGQPLPASRPAVHTSVEAADAEAKRLASVHTGQEFGVFAMTGTPHKVEKTYEHEWQRLAADGRRPLAVSSLVRAAGISQRQAESIVCGFAA